MFATGVGYIPPVEKTGWKSRKSFREREKLIFAPFFHEVVTKKVFYPYHLFKLLLGFILVPLRMIASLFFIALCSFLCRALRLFGSVDEFGAFSHKSRCGRVARIFTIITARSLLFITGHYFIRVKGKSHQTKIAVAGPHSSWADILLLISQGYTSFISSSFVRKIPLVGLIAATSGSIFVDRYDKDSRSKVRKALIARAQDKDAPGIIVFPEGATTNAKMLIQFKAGIFRAGVPVQGALIRYPHMFDRPYWDVNAALPHLCVMLSQFINHVSITFLDAHYPTKEELADPFLFANNVRREIASAGKLMTSSLTQRHKLLYQDWIFHQISWGELIKKIESEFHTSEKDLIRIGCKDLSEDPSKYLKEMSETLPMSKDDSGDDQEFQDMVAMVE
ncbi:hypothetical protein ADUPG1_012002 [Aduncisulcus paluster]|uniref:Phospholipid/glycerol acyltransferase domain-containing protein n=1 Tax=Aduncisulcus paluster TaxID=2918883 RepID=A0ABQ5K238_9EUKA|nr:hypothetical protein ADUPG1_012002 [Aduncisulcus paluster]|eukprot:gnl/Carplike_NY0171/8726_a12129_181.p1 GENE.gnl/Carplike_NY0171/8726_a12129_181~~gnl/Carplike_NY0171/8726_a12129_181.p1  ORF type:complete len:401 (-),score=57.75 gnl/Carplike_NY0171/8726_a12129_181:270-1445(-)